MLLLLLLSALADAGTPQFIRVGDDARCGPPVAGHAVLCLGSQPLYLSGSRDMMLRVTGDGAVSVVNATTNRTLWTVLSNGAAAVGYGTTPGAAGTITVGMRAVVPYDDSIYTVHSALGLAGGGVIYNVTLAGAALGGIRVVAANHESVTVLNDGTIIAGNATLQTVLAGLAGGHPVIAARAPFTDGAEPVVLTAVRGWSDVAVDGSVTVTMYYYVGNSTCGAFLSRQREIQVWADGITAHRTRATDRWFNTSVSTPYFRPHCPDAGGTVLEVSLCASSSCDAVTATVQVSLGACVANTVYFECIIAR
jgi:hypothetical protein